MEMIEWFFALFFSVAASILIISNIITCISLSDKKRPLFRIKNKYRTLKSSNTLYKCAACGKLSRRYQATLYQATGKRGGCTHCGEDEYYVRPVKQEDAWMAHHADCPKINLKGYFKVLRTIKVLDRHRADQAAMKRFEEYNDIKVDTDWIENLVRNLKE